MQGRRVILYRPPNIVGVITFNVTLPILAKIQIFHVKMILTALTANIANSRIHPASILATTCVLLALPMENVACKGAVSAHSTHFVCGITPVTHPVVGHAWSLFHLMLANPAVLVRANVRRVYFATQQGRGLLAFATPLSNFVIASIPVLVIPAVVE